MESEDTEALVYRENKYKMHTVK